MMIRSRLISIVFAVSCKDAHVVLDASVVADASDVGVVADASDVAQPTRLRIRNGCSEPIWIFYQSGFMGGTMAAPHQLVLAPTAAYDYPIPDRGIAGTRFWPGYGCDSSGNNCAIGQSGGPADQGFVCPPNGCAPPIDSKFEGTFGCLPTVAPGDCLLNPADPAHRPLPVRDGWDTSMVDGFTLPYRVQVRGNCGRGPRNNLIDCSGLPLSACPTAENISSAGQFPALASVSLRLSSVDVDAGATIQGCYSDCSRLTKPQRGGMNFSPSDPQALAYCCPTPPITPVQCSAGPVAASGYTSLIHSYCPQVYAYAYDDGSGNWSCDAGTQYEVIFYCPR